MIKNSFSDVDNWIQNYKDAKKSWGDVIEDTFYLAQTDSLYRAGVLANRILFPKESLNEFKVYFQNIRNFIPSLNLTSPILLNPPLGIPNCPADADCVCQKIYENAHDIKVKMAK